MDGSLVKYLKQLDIIESNDSRIRKLKHVHMLRGIAKEWVLGIAKKRDLIIETSKSILSCTVLVQGSTSLGVSFKNSDIDAVLVTPNFIYREDFFTSFVDVLKKHPHIKDLLPIQDTLVPLIKMRIDGTSIDLIMSRLNLPYVPCPLTFYEKPDKFYANVDHYSVHGLSGLHLSQKFREIVPEFPLFADLLKVIKTWASRRLVNEYVFGYPASIAWAVLCAYICMHTGVHYQESESYRGLLDQSILTELVELQLDSNSNGDSSFLLRELLSSTAVPSTAPAPPIPSSNNPKRTFDQRLTMLVQIFFTYFSHWLWPSPVILGPIQSVPQLRLLSWDPKNESQNRHELMPIITPIYPHKNAAYTVRTSTRNIIVRELQRGHRLVKKIIRGSAKWEDFFEPYDIRQDYRHFLRLTLTADNYQELVRLGGLIHSRLRDLASFLEEHEYIQSVRITQFKDLPNSVGATSSQSNGYHGSEDSADGDRFSRAWLLGMSITQAPPLPDGTQPERQVDVTEYLIRFFNVLQERDSRTNFLDKLVASAELQRKR